MSPLKRRVAELEQRRGPAVPVETVEAKRARYRGYLDAAFGDAGNEVYDEEPVGE